MKKSLSLLLAVVFVCTTAVTAFANTQNDFSLSADEKSGVVLDDGFLAAGENYFFPVNVSVNGQPLKPMDEEIYEDYTLKMTVSKSSDFNELKLIPIKGVYGIYVDVKETLSASHEEITLKLKFSNKKGTKNEIEKEVIFEVGNKSVNDSVVEDFDKDDTITVSNDSPVFTEEQLKKIAKKNNYKPVTFEGEGWEMVVNVSDMKGINLSYNFEHNDYLVNKYPDSKMEFINFPANTKFHVNGLLNIDVEDISAGYLQKFYVYRIENGKLMPVAASYDHEEDVLTISSLTMGSFVITDKQISDLTVGGTNNGSNSGNNGNSETQPQNPSTGASI